MSKETVLQSQPFLLNVSQVANTLGLSRTMVYTLIATQGLPTVRFGRAVRVSPVSLQRWLEKREQGLSA
jgi:excisionase family DNA binding protein